MCIRDRGEGRGRTAPPPPRRPLFHFDVHDDVRVGAFDHRVEKDESHAGKVMEKRVYERMKDKFPYSRFEMYDPDKKWDEYTVHGNETHGAGVNTDMI